MKLYNCLEITNMEYEIRNTKVGMGRSYNSDTDSFDIVVGVFREITFVLYTFIIFLNYALRTFIDLLKMVLCKKKRKGEKQTISSENNDRLWLRRWSSVSY